MTCWPNGKASDYGATILFAARYLQFWYSTDTWVQKPQSLRVRVSQTYSRDMRRFRARIPGTYTFSSRPNGKALDCGGLSNPFTYPDIVVISCQPTASYQLTPTTQQSWFENKTFCKPFIIFQNHRSSKCPSLFLNFVVLLFYFLYKSDDMT